MEDANFEDLLIKDSSWPSDNSKMFQFKRHYLYSLPKNTLLYLPKTSTSRDMVRKHSHPMKPTLTWWGGLSN